MSDPVQPQPLSQEITRDSSTQPRKARPSRRLLGLFRPTDEQLATEEGMEEWDKQMFDAIQEEIARSRSSPNQKS